MSKNTQGVIGQMVNFYWKPLKNTLITAFVYFIYGLYFKLQ